MKSSNVLDSVIGTVLYGKSNSEPRPNTKMEGERLLEKYNPYWTVLKTGAKCEIFKECERNAEYSDIKIRLLNMGVRG